MMMKSLANGYSDDAATADRSSCAGQQDDGGADEAPAACKTPRGRRRQNHCSQGVSPALLRTQSSSSISHKANDGMEVEV
mmetsp:Transcript_2881/g.6407  ORF Transcript_2881/g.6407 Transcript_2881/m.6407 type:complete len:80 (+) Transcript_2881:405-644(+)